MVTIYLKSLLSSGLVCGFGWVCCSHEVSVLPKGHWQNKQLLSPTPTAGQRELLLFLGEFSFYASLELRKASVNRSAGWGGSTCFQVAFPESVLEEWSWELKVLAQTLVPGSAIRGVSAKVRSLKLGFSVSALRSGPRVGAASSSAQTMAQLFTPGFSRMM